MRGHSHDRAFSGRVDILSAVYLLTFVVGFNGIGYLVKHTPSSLTSIKTLLYPTSQ